MNFYVYSILDPRKPGKYSYKGLDRSFLYEPIYIGKGKGPRLNHHLKPYTLKNYDSFKNRKLKSILKSGLKPITNKLQTKLEEQEALSLEKQYIAKIGRYPKGPLTNLTNGGDGVSGLKHTKESLEKMSSNWFDKGSIPWNTGKKMSKEHCKKLRESHLGKPLSEKTKEKLSKIRTGIKKSKEHKQKISTALCKNTYKLKSPSGEIYEFKNYNQFGKEHGLYPGNLCSLLQGKFKQYKGWTQA